MAEIQDGPAKPGDRVSYPARPAYKQAHFDEDTSHQTISSFFLGPKAENFDWFKKQLDEILEAVRDARLDYFPRDKKGITEEIRSSTAFRKSARRMTNAIRQASRLLAVNSVPFWSPRYQGHMCMDMSMPALLGYFMTMMYNPNNVTIEVSPLTTVAEICVGDDLCEMFGFNTDPDNTDYPLAWGHITCDGTVANLESVWVARNLKYYPLALRRALDGPLSFIADDFDILTCNGTTPTKYRDLSSWELLNLKSKDILDIPERLYRKYYISPQFLDGIMKTYGIQTTSKRVMDDQFNVKQGRMFVSNTKHYSWPKSAAITGIGSENVIGLKIDHSARVDINDLEEQLEYCLNEQIPVFIVVAIIGSTEEGCVDPVRDILQLRTKFQERGLTFHVHGDGAWGGYFCNMLPLKFALGEKIPLPSEGASPEGFVPDAGLKQNTAENLYMLREADSVTVDPHKAAYIPYPAGGLCYRDGRLRYLVTWTSPYISRGETNATSIGVFGVEGSKPGASVMSTWLANQCIGLNPEGYGKLLGEVTFTCSRLAAEWAAMTEDDVDNFRVVPLNMLPVEYDKDCTPGKIKDQRKFIREHILCKSNFEIAQEDEQRPEEKKAMWLLRELGSDLNINAFGSNWKYEDGTWNDDVEEANYFNQLVIQDLSIDSPEDEPTKIPFYLTSTTFMIHEYGECAQHLKKRLGLIQDDTDLLVMRNVVMSPWPTDTNFLSELMGEYKAVMEKHVQTCRDRNNKDPETHDFLLQGTDKVYAVHFPLFNLGKHRHQVSFEIKLAQDVMDQYVALKRNDPEAVVILRSIDPILLEQLIKNSLDSGYTSKISFRGAIGKKVPKREPYTATSKAEKKKTERERNYDMQVLSEGVDVEIVAVVKARSLKAQYRDRSYPDSFIPFYAYGTLNNLNIDHVLVRSPNISLSAENVEYKSENGTSNLTDEHLARGSILIIKDLSEAAMQPFQSTEGDLKDTFSADSEFFFSPGKQFKVDIYEDPFEATEAGPGLVDVVGEHTHASDSAALLHNHGHGVPKGATGGGKAFRHVDANVHVSGITGTTPAAKKSSGLTNGVANGDDKPKKEFKLIDSGTITLGKSLYIDSVQINKDPFYVAEGAEKFKKWKEQFDTIGKELE